MSDRGCGTELGAMATAPAAATATPAARTERRDAPALILITITSRIADSSLRVYM
jgi:hypothetical protein